MRRLRRIFSAPIRFFQYLDRPGQELKARHEAMTPAEKEAWRADSLKRNGLFLAFVNLKAPKRRR
jgi:hypothetical protein